MFVVPLLDSATGTTLIGVQIDFGNTNALRIEYATDSQVANVRATSGGVWKPPATLMWGQMAQIL